MLSHFSCVQLCDPMDCSPFSFMGFPRQEYWRGLPSPPPGDLPKPGIKPLSPMSPALAGGFFTTSASWKDLRSSLVSPKHLVMFPFLEKES